MGNDTRPDEPSPEEENLELLLLEIRETLSELLKLLEKLKERADEPSDTDEDR